MRNKFVRPASFAAASLAVAACLAAAGCGEEALPVVRTGAAAAGAAAAGAGGQCERRLAGAADVLAPGTLGRTAEAGTAARLLSLYVGEEACTGVPPGPLPLDPAAAELANAVLGDGGADYVADRRVDAAGARFLSTRLLDAAAASAVAGGAGDSEAVAVALNKYVAGILFPINPDGRPAGTTYHARLRGGGDWADRAWLLADMLRQRGIDAVLLSPADWGDGTPAGQRTAWVGVILPGGGGAEVALFDMRTGLPVPSANDPERPARLSELASDAGRAAMRAFYETAGIGVPSAASVAAVTPRLIAEPAWFRLAHGLIGLPPAEVFGVREPDAAAPVVYAPLHGPAATPGLVGRVAGAFGLGPREVTLWPVPGERADAANAADDADLFPATLAAPLRLGLRPARGGVEFTAAGVQFDSEGAEPATGASDAVWRLRHLQLTATNAGRRAAAAGFAALLPDAGGASAPGSLLGAPLPPTTDRDRRAYRGRAASGELGTAAAGAAEAAPAGEDDLETVYQVARENGVAPWPGDRPTPEEYQRVNGAAGPDVLLFLAAAEAARGRDRDAAGRLAALVSGGANPRRPAAASLLIDLAAAGGDLRAATDLARAFADGPDGPRLKVLLGRRAAE